MIATILAQKEYLEEVYEMLKKTNQVAGAVVNRLSVISDKAIKKLPSLDDVADKIEGFVDKVDIKL